MNEERFEPEEFERLLALPEDHPERVRAERSGRLAAWQHMLDGFESPPGELLSSQDLARAEAELAQRVERATAPAPARVRPAIREASWLTEWRTGGRRVAVAFAALAIVAAAGWWSVEQRRERPAVRGSAARQALELISRPVAAGVELSWTPVPGATMYRLVFFGPELTELARVDSLVGTSFALRADQLPAGLASGQTVLVEVAAVLPYDTFASKSVSIAVP